LEYKSQVTVSSPSKERFRPTIIEKIDEFDKNAIRQKFTIFGGTVKYQQLKKCWLPLMRMKHCLI